MPLWKAIKVTNGCDFTSMEKQSVCESQRGGFWEQTWGCVYLCPLWEPPGLQGVREERGRGITGWTMFTRSLRSFSCATLGLFCSPEATAKLIKKRQVRPPWDNNTNPLLPTPAPLYPQTPGNKDEGRRGAKEEECMLQWLLHSGAAWKRPSVFSSSAHFHLDVSEWTVQMSAGEWQAVKGDLKRGRKETTEYRGPNGNEHFENLL